MITKERLIDLICSYAEGATDNVADGVLYNSLADAILLELQPNGAKPIVSGSLPLTVGVNAGVIKSDMQLPVGYIVGGNDR